MSDNDGAVSAVDVVRDALAKEIRNQMQGFLSGQLVDGKYAKALEFKRDAVKVMERVSDPAMTLAFDTYWSDRLENALAVGVAKKRYQEYEDELKKVE